MRWHLLPWLWILFPAAAATAEIQRLEVTRDDQLFQIRLEARIAAPEGAVWATLTDYPNLHRLAPAVKLSEVVDSDPDGSRRVRTLSHVCVWIFCRDLKHVQRFLPKEPGLLEADSVPQQSDFAFGQARWSLTPEPDGTSLEFTARLRPAFWVPPLIGPLLVEEGLRSTTQDVLQGLEREARLRP